MADQRTPRSSETREDTSRPSDAWVPSAVLPVPAPQDGFQFFWVRTSTLGQFDATNVSKKFREGWSPVLRSEHPELKVMSDINSRFKENVEIGGLLLCKAPIEMIRQRRAYFEKMAVQQMESVDNNFMRENDPRMPLLNPERSSRTEFGRS